jgi:hypothetical protein
MAEPAENQHQVFKALSKNERGDTDIDITEGDSDRQTRDGTNEKSPLQDIVQWKWITSLFCLYLGALLYGKLCALLF